MYFIAVAIVNLAYIFSELMFNTKLLNVSGGSFNYSDIETIEILGRALSSIGLSLVLVRTIYFFRISKGSKIFLSSLVIIIAHPVFFLGQKEFIDYLAKQTPDFQQQAFYNALLSKRAMLFDQDIEENIPYLKERTDTEKKVFFSSIGLIKNESGVGDIYGPKKSKEIIINNEAVTLANTLLNDYQDPVINESTYFLYSNIQQSYYKKIKLIDKQADGYYERYTSESARQAFYSQYAGLLEKIQKGENFFRNVMPSKVGAKLISIGRCITKDCYEKKTTGFETFQKNLARKYLKEKTEELTTFPFDYFCTQGNSKNSRTIIRTHKNGATDTRTHTNRMGNHSANTTLRCDVDLNHLGNAYLSKYKQTIDNTLNLSFKKYESLESFSKSSDFNDFIMYTAKRSGVRLILPKEWIYKDKATFVKAVAREHKTKLEADYRKKIKEQAGLSLPLILSREEFMDKNNLRKIIKNEYLEEFDIQITAKDNFKSFFAKNEESLRSIVKSELDELNAGIENQSRITKSMLIPPLSLFLSSLFLILNFMLFTRNLVPIRYANHSSITLFAIFFTIPFIGNLINGSNIFIGELSNTSILKSSLYVWLNYIESLIYPLGEFLSNILSIYDLGYVDQA